MGYLYSHISRWRRDKSHANAKTFIWLLASIQLWPPVFTAAESSEDFANSHAPTFNRFFSQSSVLFTSYVDPSFTPSVRGGDAHISCFSNGNPSPSSYGLLVSGEEVASSNTSFKFQVSSLPASSLLLGRDGSQSANNQDKDEYSGIFPVQCRASNTWGTAIHSSLYLQVVKVPKRHTVTHNTNGHGFAKLDCRDLLANAAVQSRLVGTDMHDRIQWVHRGVPLVPGLLNFQESGGVDDLNGLGNEKYLITYHSQLVLLDVQSESVSSYFCLFDGQVIAEYQVHGPDNYQGQSPDDFVLAPIDVEAIERVTKYVQLDCIGPNMCKPDWYFGDKKVLQSSYHLRISTPDVSHAGVYSCKCAPVPAQDESQDEQDNGGYYPTKSATLRVQKAPTENLGDTRLSVRLLEKKELYCEIDWPETAAEEQSEYIDKPVQQYSWLRNGKIISNTVPADESWQQILKDGGRSLQLFPRDTLHDSLSGVYQCQTTVFGKEPLMITSLPILVQIQNDEVTVEISWVSDSELVEGSRALLECKVDGGSIDKNVKWFFKGEGTQQEAEVRPEDYNSDKFISRGFSRTGNALLFELMILATIDDSGSYTCQVEDRGNNKVTNSQPTQLKVLHRTTLISGLVDSWGARLSRVEMFCIARLDETAGRGYSRWMFTPENGGPLVSEMELRAEDDPDIRITKEVIEGRLPGTKMVNSTLTISKVVQERAGTYTCQIANVAGYVSSSAVFTVHARPSKPPKVQARQFDDQVCIEWPNVDGSEPISHVIVEYKKTEEYGKKLPLDNDDWTTYARSYRNPVCLTSLKPWSTYVFKVSLNNSIGRSEFSDESDPLVIPEDVPTGAPENVNVVALNSSSLQVAFERIPQEQRNGEILEYWIDYNYAEAPYGIWERLRVKNDSFTAVITNLAAYERILVTVRGRTSVGPGKKSEVKEARTKEGIPARNIRLSKGLVTATSIGISWHHLPSHQWKGDLKNYLIYITSVGADFSSTINRTIEVDSMFSAYTVTDLTPHTKYSISGSFFNGVYHPSEKSNVLNITTQESTPGPVSEVRWFDVTHESVRLVWSDPDEPNGVITGYSIQMFEIDPHMSHQEPGSSDDDKGNGLMIHNITVDSETNEYWIVNLTESTDYELEITALTKMGPGVIRVFKFSSGVPPELPQPPNNINILNVSARSAKIKFSHGFNGHTSINKWKVEIRKEWRQSWKESLVHEVLDSPEITSIELPNILSPFSQYKLRVIACNIEGCSDPSPASLTFQTEPDIPGLFPANVLARPLPNSQILVTWSEIFEEDWNDDIASCSLILNYSSSSGDQNRIVLAANETSYVLNNVPSNRLYTFEVQTKNSRGMPTDFPPKVTVKTVQTELCDLNSDFSYKRDAHWATIHWFLDHESLPCLLEEIYYYQAQILYKGGVVQSIRVPAVSKPLANFTDLYANVTYFVRVAVVNGAGMGKWSKTKELIAFLAPPDYPENVWVRMQEDSGDGCSFSIYGHVERELHIQNISYTCRISETGDEFSDSLVVAEAKIEDVKSAEWFHHEFSSCPFNSILHIDLNLLNTEGESPTRSFEIEVPLKSSNKKWPQKHVDPVKELVHSVGPRWAQLHWEYERLVEVQNFTVSVFHDIGTAINVKPELSVTTSELHANISGLLPDEKYKVTVVANGYFGKSSEGASKTFETDVALPDFAPDVPEYVVKNGQVVFTNLKKPKQMNGIFQKYELEYRALDSDDTLYTVQSGHTQTFTTEVLKVRVTYQMRLAVSNRVGMSPWSQYFYPFIQEDEVKNAPRNVQVIYNKSGPTFLFVTWEEPSFNANTNSEANHIHGYQVCYWKKLSELEDTTENENELRSGRNRGELDMANEVSEHQKETGLFKTVDDAEVSKTCQNVTHTQQRTNVTLEYLEGFTGYFIQVSAFNSRGIGPKSEAPEAETDIGIPESVPRVDIRVLTGSMVEVTWDKPVHSHGTILRYFISCSVSSSPRKRRSADDNFGGESTSDVLGLSVAVSGDESSEVVNGLQPDTFYEMQIQAQTKAGESEPTSVTFFTGAQTDKPAPPSGKPEIKQTSDDVISVSWEAPDQQNDLEPVINYSIYLLYRDPRTFLTDAFILNKTLTRERQISVHLNSSHWLWSLLDQNDVVWIAVASINRNGQGVLGSWAEYRPSDYSDDGSPLPKTTSGGFMDSDWLILSILCGLLLIFVVIASAAVIILICRKIKSSDHKSLRRNRNQVYKGAPHDSSSHYTMMQRIQEAAELDFLPMPQDRNSVTSTTLGHPFAATSSIHAGSVQGLNYAGGVSSNEQIAFSGQKHPNNGSSTMPTNNQMKFAVNNPKSTSQFQNTPSMMNQQQPPFMHEYSFPNRVGKPMSPLARTKTGPYAGEPFDETLCTTSGVYSMPVSSNDADYSEERTEMDSDSSKSFSHQPDAVDDQGNSFSLHPVNRFPSTFAPDANESLPLGTEMGTFGRSHAKKRQSQTPAIQTPVNISQTRIPLHIANGVHAPNASYIPPVGLQATTKQLNFRESPVPSVGESSCAVNGNSAGKTRHGSVSRPMASFRASIDEDEDSI